MKKLLLFLAVVVVCLKIAAQSTPDLRQAESKIQMHYDGAFEKDPGELITYINELKEARKTNGEPYLVYWYCFANYWLSQYYIRTEPANQKEAEEALTIAIKNMDMKEKKNSEDYTLLAILLSYSIKFSPGKAVVISSKANQYLEKALKMDDKNPRTYIAIGRSDYYKPVEYGGGKIVESTLLKALSLKDKNNQHPYAPSWGRSMAYELIVAFYKREGRKDDALVYARKGLKEFPGNKSLQEQTKELGE